MTVYGNGKYVNDWVIVVVYKWAQKHHQVFFKLEMLRQIFFMKLQSVEPEILVELYDYQSVECGSAMLTSPYQPFIDEGLVEIDGTVCSQEG